MFTSIRESGSPGGNYLSDRIHAHYCAKCGQVFTAKFDFIPSMGWQRWSGDYFVCPRCGEHQYKNYLTVSKETDTGGEWLPTSLRIILYEFKKHLRLSIKGDCIRFSDDGHYVSRRPVTEEIIFDIKSKRVVYKSDTSQNQELGNPFLATDFLKHSLLRFVIPESTTYQSQRKIVFSLMKTLRERITKKMKEIHGIDLKAMSIHPSKQYGLFLLPIVNIAWRIACPDAKNLPLFEAVGDSDIDHYGYRLNECRKKNGDFPIQLVENVMDYTRGGLSYPQSVAKAYRLPDTKGIRKLLSEQDIFKVGTIKIGFNMMREYKYRILAAKQLLIINGSDYYRSNRNPNTLSNFIKKIVHNFGDKITARLLLDFERLQVTDIIAMYSQLNRENRKKFMGTSLTAERMHDWMVDVLDYQEHTDHTLDIPEDFTKRVEMRLGFNKFFVPQTAHELRCAGKKLRNCVGTYAKRVLARETDIVLVTDRKGDLAICIEVCNNKIIQAKLFDNARVERDPILNEQVKVWAKKTELIIATSDVDIKEPERVEQLIAV